MQPHEHRDDAGFVVKCYHHCRTVVFSFGFWIGITLSFPFEHLLWERVWPFYQLTHLLGI